MESLLGASDGYLIAVMPPLFNTTGNMNLYEYLNISRICNCAALAFITYKKVNMFYLILCGHANLVVVSISIRS